MFAAFAALGIVAEPVVYSDGRADPVRDQLLALDGVLVWVNPIEQGLDRSLLDPLLREAAAAGVWVSAHPDVILRIATKQVLAETASMSWSAETHLYRTLHELGEQLPRRLAGGSFVLKQQRGMGGEGVWKVELDPGGVRVQHAAEAAAPFVEPLDAFIDRCRPSSTFSFPEPAMPAVARAALQALLAARAEARSSASASSARSQRSV